MNIKKTLRQFRIALGKLLLDKKKTPPADDSPPKSVLFLRQDGKIGDYIVSSFVFRELKKQNPDIHIGVVCTAKNAFLFRQNPYIDQLYLVKKRSIPSIIKCGRILRRFRYDALIDPTVMLRNRDLLFIRLINAKINLGYQKNHYKIFNRNVMQSGLHFSDIYRQALQLLGFDNIDTRYDIPQNEEVKAEVRSFLALNSITRFIAVNFYGNGSARRFSDEKIIGFLSCLRQNTALPIILLTYPQVTLKLKRLAEDFDLVFIDDNTTNIFYSIEYIRYCQLLISPDTATVHIAAGLDKPMIAFYSDDEENFAHWHPNGRNVTHILRYHENINEIDPRQIEREWLRL